MSALVAIGISAGLLLAVLGLWLAAARLAPALLRPGHGPLWIVAAALVAAAELALIAVASPRSPALWLSERLDVAAAGPGALTTHLALALAALLVAFALARAAFAALRPRAAGRPPIPRLFLLAGVAPDGAALTGLRRAVRALALALLAACATAPAWGPGAPDTTVWAAGVAALVALVAAMSHPTPNRRAARPLATAPADAPPVPLGRRVDAIHAHLGAPPEADRLAPIRPAADAPRDPLTALRLYPFQARLLAPDRPRAIALAGPHGSGRTAAALLVAAHGALERGATAALIAPTAAAAAATAALAQRLFGGRVAGLALTVSDGPSPGGADLWCVSVAALERFLAGHVQLAQHAFVARLELVVVDDVEELSGARVAVTRFLVHRLAAAAPADAVAAIVCGRLGGRSLEEAARCVLAREATLWRSDGDGGAPSLAVRRFVVPRAPDGDLAADLARLAARDRVAVALEGGPWRPLAPDAGATPEVLVSHIGPDTAWRVLTHRRHYAPARPGDDHAREYLLFGGDPLARLLGAWHAAAPEGSDPAPAWLDPHRFPRMLTAVPGDLDAPDGLLALARRHLRAALAEAPQDTARLGEVFSPALVADELAAVRDSGLLAEAVGWRLGDPAAPRPVTGRRVAMDGHADHPALHAAPLAALREPRAGLTFEVEAQLLDLVYFDRAIVDLDGRLYEVRRDGARAGERVIVPAAPRYSTPIRTTRVRRLPHSPLAEAHHRFRGRDGFVTLSGRLGLDLTHLGARHFTLDGHRVHEILEPTPRALPPFVTSARVLCPPTDDPAVLHTLAHVLRDALDYFYLRASASLGVTWAGRDELGVAGVVFYDRHPDGLGNVYDIDDGLDWQALLEAARAVLSACACAGHCAACCESTRCTLAPHNVGLDRAATLAVLDRLLGVAPAPAGRPAPNLVRLSA